MLPTSPRPCTTPNAQLPTSIPNPLTQSLSSPDAASGTEDSSNGLQLLLVVCADNVYSPAIQIYDDGLTRQATVTISPTQASIPAITQTSPGTNCQTAVALFQDRASKKHQCLTTKGANIKKKHKSWKCTHNSKTSMMLFLQEE